MTSSNDPEVTALTARVRSLTELAQHLSSDIAATVSELKDFRQEIGSHEDQRRKPGV